MKRKQRIKPFKVSWLLLLFCLLLRLEGFAQESSPVPSETSAYKRLALVVGNNDYPKIPLKNAINDARSMSRVLGELGFEVQSVENSTLIELAKAVDTFIGRLGAGDVGLFFFSGHGIQIEGVNYLLPVDFDAPDEVEAKYRSYSAERVRERMEDARVRLSIIVLDACRNNPFRVSRSGGQGLAAMNSGRGTLIAFATGPGKTASDNTLGENGLFTLYLIESLQVPGLKLDDVFNRTRQKVDAASGHRQTPWVVSSVIGDFYFTSGHSTDESSLSPDETPPPAETPGEEQQVRAEPPPVSPPDFSEIRQRAEARKEWENYQNQMKKAYAEALDLEVASHLNPEEKAQAWKIFIETYNAENPFDEEDNRLLAQAQSRLTYWQDQVFSPPEKSSPLESTESAIPGRYPEASLRYLTDADLRGKPAPELKIMRNEIFARHGYIFQTAVMRTYFRRQPWYKPRYKDVSSMLTDIESANIELIKKYEK